MLELRELAVTARRSWLKPRNAPCSRSVDVTSREARMSWGHGVEGLASLIWVAVVVYLLTLGARLVRAVEKIAGKFENKPQ